jgi:hypothetical protein
MWNVILQARLRAEAVAECTRKAMDAGVGEEWLFLRFAFSKASFFCATSTVCQHSA